MNNTYYDINKYNEFNAILSGCKTIIDAHYFGEIYIKNNPEMRGIIKSMIIGKNYYKSLSLKDMMSIVHTINRYQYHDEIYELTNTYMKKTIDNVQLSTIKRISKNKIIRDSPLDAEKKYVVKSCPHCEHKYSTSQDIKQVICGYDNMKKGYDWKGCNRDWCFTCSKKLCKIWKDDQLFVPQNRKHDEFCCRNNAKDEIDYLTNYCQCHNEYVNRFSHNLLGNSDN